jgi:ABC-2 type transport system permease protein
MNTAPAELPPVLNPAPAQTRTLRKLFLTIYLRGRSSRGLKLQTAPRSVARKLAVALAVYTLFGLFSVRFLFNHEPLFALAIYAHSMTFVFLGMFVSSSAGEVLFNKDEADILMHRPITTKDLLWSKIRVMIQISLWLAGALNLGTIVVGIYTFNGGILFPFIHIISTVLEALFCTGCVVLTYQLCLRWFGRERLDSFMTMTQVMVAIALVMAGQILPRLMFRLNQNGLLHFDLEHWWLALIPPGWFAGLDDAVAAHGNGGSWLLAGIGLIATALVLWLAFGKLAENYGAGLQSMGETASRPPARSGTKRRWTETLASLPPLKWFSPVSRAGFVLTVAYLFRDRDVKLRVFPGIAPMLVMPLVFLFQGQQAIEGFWAAFSSCFLATIPLFALDLLQYSQQWQASDIFRVAPMAGPAELCQGARWAVLCLLAVPAFILIGAIVWVAQHNISHLLLFLPGLILVPIVSLIPATMRRGVPLSFPNEEIKSAGRSVKMMSVMIFAVILSAFASWAFKAGWFWWFMLAETVIALPVYFGLSAIVSRLRWKALE